MKKLHLQITWVKIIMWRFASPWAKLLIRSGSLLQLICYPTYDTGTRFNLFFYQNPCNILSANFNFKHIERRKIFFENSFPFVPTQHWQERIPLTHSSRLLLNFKFHFQQDLIRSEYVVSTMHSLDEEKNALPFAHYTVYTYPIHSPLLLKFAPQIMRLMPYTLRASIAAVGKSVSSSPSLRLLT